MDNTLPSSPTLSAEDIGRRVIRLVQNLRSVEDISPANLERQMGIKVHIRKDNPNHYGFGGPIGGSWVYDLEVYPDKKGEAPRSLDFAIDDRSPNDDADMAPIQTLSFNDYRDALVAAGYSVERHRHGRLNDPWVFTRGDIIVRVHMQRYKDPEKVTAYVRTLSVYFAHPRPTTQKASA